MLGVEDSASNDELNHALGIACPTVLRWWNRYTKDAVAGARKDAPRDKPRAKVLARKVVAIVASRSRRARRTRRAVATAPWPRRRG